MKRLFLIDGMAILYRGHYGMVNSPKITEKGENTSCLFYFVNIISKLIREEKLTHITIALDSQAPTFRHKLLPQYKQQRKAIPPEIVENLPRIDEFCRLFKIPLIKVDGYEADDILGTLAKQAEENQEFKTFIVSTDKDLSQLITEKILIWKPGYRGSKPKIIDLSKMQEEWGIQDSQKIIDILALWGDRSDNIEGVPSIGEKTAKKLISQFENIENLLACINETPERYQKILKENQELIHFNKKLVTIDTKCPIEFSEQESFLRQKNSPEIQAFLERWNLEEQAKTLLKTQTPKDPF